MNLFTKAKLTYDFIKWRLTWDRRNTHYRFTVPGNGRFMGPRDAVKLIPDGAVVGLTGLGANMRASIMYWAIREVFEETGHPRGLTLLCPGGFGGRGRVPGTPEELGVEGLCTRLFTGHTETFKSLLRLADKGKLELQCIPQGTFILLLAAMAEGEDAFVTETGTGTVIDPRVGRGTPVLNVGPQYVHAENGGLRYTCPKLDVAVFNAPAADRKGNLYVKRAAMIGESREMAKAAKRNGGLVIANVGKIVDEGYDEIFLPAEEVDAIVYYPKTEQTGSKYHRRPLKMLTTESNLRLDEGLARVRFVNRLVGVTPKRSEVDAVVARLAATVFAEHLRKGALVNFGVGMPEEVSRLLFDSGLFIDMTGFTESGVFGGVAAPGIFFGAGINPTEIVSSAE
ncbi:MAG TPA: malonate decarboxylase subunit alpha, partial [Candidatus Hydrogenedentes bacterium]|nr:malonate decarboxylase subunit alpha [Candidatus Hydrogenedentota bacterium]